MSKPEENKDKIKNKLINFWYYYKVPAIIFLLVLAVVIYFFLTGRQTVSSDYDIAIVSPYGCSGEQLAQLQNVLQNAGQDQNGDGNVSVDIHVYQFAIGVDRQDMNEIAGLDADLVGKQSGIFFTENPEKFEESTNGIGKAADAVPVRTISALSGCGIDDLYLLIRSGADERYNRMFTALIK